MRLALGGGVAEVAQHLRRRRARMSSSLAAHPERVHQRARVRERQLARGEAGHRVREHVRARQPQPVHRARGDDQRVRRVEPARDADHDAVDPGRAQPRLEALDLDRVDLLAALVAADGVGRHVREPLDLASQRHAWRAAVSPSVELDRRNRASARRWSCTQSPKLLVVHAVGDEPVEVDVGEDQLLLVGEALRLGELLAVLVDQRLAVPGEVGRRLAERRRR